MQEADDHIDLAAASPVAALPAEALRWRCDPGSLGFQSTGQVPPITGVIGQDTAVDALRFGLEIHAPGQNIFVRGLVGTGRMTLISRLLTEIRPSCPDARDRCYVHNFAHPDRPRLITLPRGTAPEFRRRIDQLADFIRDDLPSALAAQGLQPRQSALEQQTQRQLEELLKPFHEAARQAGLGLVTVQLGHFSQAALMPLVEGKPVPPEEWEQLRAQGKITDEQAAQIEQRRTGLEQQLNELMITANQLRQRHNETLRALLEQTTRSILDQLAQAIIKEFDQQNVRTFLGELIEHVTVQRAAAKDKDADHDRRYRVNVILSHADGAGCPIIVENIPTMTNLLGMVDHKIIRAEATYSDHHMISAGSLLRADGGYLILEVRDLLREPGAWKVLVRTLRTGRLEIVPQELAYPWWIPSIKPEPIDLNIKVILLGDSEMYYLLDSYDPDFPNLFKVLADFDSVIPRSPEGISQYAAVLARIVQEEGLMHFSAAAVALLVEHGARIASRQDKLTTRFGRLADIAREATFFARKAGRQQVTREDVQLAIRKGKDRASLPSRRFRELLAEGTIRLALKGSAVGQINGTAVIQAGPLTYGFPSRITATIGPGTAGVINIEREADLSGSIHTKGFYILGGLLRHLLRTDHPLAFHASIAFEQTYGGIDGDSASAAEICCLLSALTEIPLRQDLAMTGAIDQTGNILAVGAVNEKIEGFFEACQDIGLVGTEGVVIPQANARDLMLREDVVEACRAGRFHVYPVESIGQALELFTGIKAGDRHPESGYPEDTLLGLAVMRAYEYWLKASQTAAAQTDLPLPPEAGNDKTQGAAG